MSVFSFWAPAKPVGRTRRKVWLGRQRDGWYVVGLCSKRPSWSRAKGFRTPGVLEEMFCAFRFESITGFKLKRGAKPVEVRIMVEPVVKRKRQ